MNMERGLGGGEGKGVPGRQGRIGSKNIQNYFWTCMEMSKKV